MQRSQYQIFPPHPAAGREALKTSITYHDGIQNATIWDDQGNLLDGWERESICEELGIVCPREVRTFESEAEKFQFILAVNVHRRSSLSTKQKREVISGYLKGDPLVADKTLGDKLGVSKNTVLEERRRLESTGQIRKVEKTKGKDGKCRPVTYLKRIITNTPNEFKKAQEIIKDLPDNCDGKVVDIATAKRRARRERSRKNREARDASSHPLPDSIHLFHCPFQELERVASIKPGTVKLILTDIPYAKEWHPQIADLGDFAARMLAPGGLLLVMTGILMLDKILAELRKADDLTLRFKLEIQWKFDGGTQCYIGKSALVVSSSKPIWVYSKGPFLRKGRFVTPLQSSEKQKDWHAHQQPLDCFRFLVREYSDPGDLVVDTCGGGFTTAESCFLEGRRFTGCDVSEKCVENGRDRLRRAAESVTLGHDNQNRQSQGQAPL